MWFQIREPAEIGNAHFVAPNKAIAICDVPFTKDMRLVARPKRKCPVCTRRRKAKK